jgi:hypothetical protein
MSEMQEKPRYSIKQYIWMLVLSCTGGLLFAILIPEALGFGHKGTLVVIVLWFPSCIFAALYGFYRGLVQ